MRISPSQLPRIYLKLSKHRLTCKPRKRDTYMHEKKRVHNDCMLFLLLYSSCSADCSVGLFNGTCSSRVDHTDLGYDGNHTVLSSCQYWQPSNVAQPSHFCHNLSLHTHRRLSYTLSARVVSCTSEVSRKQSEVKMQKSRG